MPTPLRVLTKGQGELRVEAASVRELLERLEQEYAGIKSRLCEDDGTVRRFINLYVNEEDIRFLQGLDTPLKAGDEVSVVPAIAGGREGAMAGRLPRVGGSSSEDEPWCSVCAG
jgi:molybdopterin synthase sulfur carrier subunit